ncbi:MAG: potassium-transporting ATPase subunit C [Bdellovibrionota bacterium]
MKTLMISVRFLLVSTLLTGFIYPVAVTVMAKVFPAQVNGSVELIGQKFTAEKYFMARPSAIDYNPMPSGGSNAGSINQDWLAKVKERQSTGASLDLLYASASGLDPHISPASALSQIDRVARARGVNPEVIRATLQAHIEGRQLGFLGEERLNVLRINKALDAQFK